MLHSSVPRVTLPLRVLAWEAATGGTLLAVIFTSKDHGSWKKAPSQTPLGKIPSFPYNEAPDQDSPGNSQGKYLEVPWLSTQPAWVSQ